MVWLEIKWRWIKLDEVRNTDEQILSAFLRLASERGIDGVTTRELANEAGVNPVTLFRRFGDKATISVEAIRRYSPVNTLQTKDPAVRPEHAEEDLVNCLLFVTELTLERRRVPWLRSGIMQFSQSPEVRAELGRIARAFYEHIRRALTQAGPALRPEVDHHATALQLIGLIKTARQMNELAGEHELERDEWRTLFQAAIRPLLCSSTAR